VRSLRTLLLVAGCASILYPLGAKEVARSRLSARLARLEGAPGVTCAALDGAALSLRVARLGPLLAGWETIGGCGAGGGTNGAGVRWIGRNTTGGLFQVISLDNYITIPKSGPTGPALGGYNIISNNQITRDFTDKWNAGVSIPYAYKWYRNPFGTGWVSNSGLADMTVLATRRLGTDNSTLLSGIVTLPTGTYRAAYRGAELSPDEQLGFGRFTGSLLLDHIFDQDWGIVLVGGAANYRGGRNAAANYRAPGATVYGYAGYFLGPLVPALGLNLVGQTQQDTRGDFGENLNTPVFAGAAQASVEWSNPYVAVLLGAYVPVALLNENWHTSGHFNLQAWVVALGLSVSPF
jgi:hypothetical protein